MKATCRLSITALGVAALNVCTVWAQEQEYSYTTDSGTIIITDYTGPGGDVIMGPSAAAYGPPRNKL